MISILQYATLKNADLVAAGIAKGEASRLRERFTGHRLRIGPLWARTIGYWGGVATIREIAVIADVSPDYAKTYARVRKLKYRTRRLQRTAAQLAVLAFATLPGAAKNAGPELGIFPAEVSLYRVAIAALMKNCGVAFHELLKWSLTELEAQWTTSGPAGNAIEIGLASTALNRACFSQT